jgi:hypothetical protein
MKKKKRTRENDPEGKKGEIDLLKIMVSKEKKKNTTIY